MNKKCPNMGLIYGKNMIAFVFVPLGYRRGNPRRPKVKLGQGVWTSPEVLKKAMAINGVPGQVRLKNDVIWGCTVEPV
jgi:hypothetical protein